MADKYENILLEDNRILCSVFIPHIEYRQMWEECIELDPEDIYKINL